MMYEQEYGKMHEKGMFRAWKQNYNEKFLSDIRKYVEKTNSKTILDYGSGKGQQYTVGKINEAMGIAIENVTCYDPGVPEFKTLPTSKFDGIISTDVFEHIPESEVDEAIRYCIYHSNKFICMVIHCGLAIKTFPDGTNVHVTVKHPRWWKERFNKLNNKDIEIKLSFKWPIDPKYNILNL